MTFYNYILSFFIDLEKPEEPPKIVVTPMQINGVNTPMNFTVSNDTELIKELKKNKLFLKLKERNES